MSAVIQNEYTGDNSTTTYSFTFPYLKTSDIKASLDGVDTTAFTLPNATTLQFNTAPGNGVKIKIFRQTSVDDLTATFYAGSAIKSEDLNDNFTQNLYKTQEIGGRFISALGGTMTGNFNLGEDADIVFEGATDNAHETTITVADPTADRTITFPNVTGTVVTTGDTGTVATGMIAGDAVNGDKIADNAINSEHYTDGSIDRVHLAADIVDGTKIADDSVDSEHLVSDSIDTEHYAAGSIDATALGSNAVTRVKIIADAVDGTKIADDSINSEHYVDGSIDNAHLADNSVSLAKMADDSVGTSELIDSSVDTAILADDSVTLAKMTNNSVGNSELVNASVSLAKMQNNSVGTSQIVDGSVDTAEIADDAVTTQKINGQAVTEGRIANNAVTTVKIADANVTTAKIADGNVTTAKIANDAITTGKIAAGAVDSSDIGNGAIDTVHVGAAQITTAKIADSNITTAKISDANVTTAKIADNAITVAKIGDKQYTITDSDTKIPTSGAVVDYVAAQLAPIGGFEAIANEQSFPNTQPSSGVVISIADAGGLAVSNSGTASGQTVGGTTVNITGIASNFNGTTVAAGIRFLVSSTGSGQNYTYHKATLKEDDLLNLSGDINDFAERYRVGSTNPTSSLDNGDLFFNTSTGKMLVYNGTNTAWEEVQSIGNFFISTLSPAFDGSTQDFTITNAPTNAEQILLVINGVVQKPNAGTSTPSEGFALTGSTVKLGAAPATGDTYHAVVIGSTVNIGTPSNNTVSTAVLQDDSVTAAKIAAGAVGSTELAANAVITSKITDANVTTAKIADNAITNAKVNASAAIAGTKISPDFGSQNIATTGNVDADGVVRGNSSNSGKWVRMYGSAGTGRWDIYGHGANLRISDNDNAGSFVVDRNTDLNGGLDVTGNITVSGTVDGVDIAALNTTVGNISTEVVNDTSPQLGGTLQTNGNNIDFADTEKARFGNAADLQIYHNGTESIITDNSDLFIIGDPIQLRRPNGDKYVQCIASNATKLFYDGQEKLATASGGVTVTGTCTATSFAGDGSSLTGISAFVSGMIMLWSGAQNAIPSGWVLCNGSNGSPDLRDRFVVGAGSSYSVGNTGGASSVTLSTSQIPSHNHSAPSLSLLVSNNAGGSGSYTNIGRARSSGNQESANSGSINMGSSTGSTGSGSSHENRPPYYALCYIMKT